MHPRTSAALACALLVVAVSPLAHGTPISPTPDFDATTFSAAGGEPNVSVSPNGKVVLVSGLAGDPATLHRSMDGGVTFTTLTPSFTSTGGGDWDMRFLDDKTVIAADLGNGILIHRSTDDGATWTTTQIQADVYDRPWIDHFGKNTIYVVAKGFDSIPYLYTSIDGGKSFGTPPVPILIYGTGTLPAEAGGTDPNIAEGLVGGQNAYVDHLTVDPRTGDVYVLYGLGAATAISPGALTGVANRLYVAHLEGGTMVSHPVHLGDASESFISGFNWMTVDSAGTIYVLANGSIGGHHSARLSYSKDRGTTWSKLADLGEPGAANVYGAIAAGAPGVLSLVYLRGSSEDPSKDQNWFAEMARVIHANTSAPIVYRTRPVLSAVHQRDICFDGILCGAPGFGKNRRLLDYIWNAIGPDGTAYGVVASDGPATRDGTGVSVIFFRQTGGASHGAGVQS